MPSSTEVEARLRAQGAPESHLRRIAALVGLAETNPDLRAIVLVGSYAKGVGDRVSDLDLVAIAAAGCENSVLRQAHALLADEEVLNQFSGTHPTGGSFWKLVYLDFSSVELHVFGQTTAFRLKRPYLPVWDPADFLASYLVPGAPIEHADFAAYEHGDEGLIWELVDCIKWLSRGRHELAKRHIKKLASKIAAAEQGSGVA